MEDFPSGKFVTMVYGVLDARSRTLTVASAGHPRPLLINHHCSFLDVDTGLPLGLGLSAYPERTIDLAPGTHVLCIATASLKRRTPQTKSTVRSDLLQHFLRPDACVDGLIAEVQRYGAASTRVDDATAVLLRSR